jgi:hypothetical protein
MTSQKKQIGCRNEERVEWMYQGGFAAQEESAKRKEEYLLGRAVDELPDQGKPEPEARVCDYHVSLCAPAPKVQRTIALLIIVSPWRSNVGSL